MKARRLMVIAAAALAVVAGATAAGAAVTGSPVRSGVIHGCWTIKAVHGSHVIKLQNEGTRCPRGTTAISWNQTGPAGPAGATGPQGAAGPQGPAGPGLDFKTASGTHGPALSAGTYFIVVKAAIPDSNNGVPLLGNCVVFTSTDSFTSAFDALNITGGAAINVASISGMLVVSTGTATPTVGCRNDAQDPVTPTSIQWWVSPVQTSS